MEKKTAKGSFSSQQLSEFCEQVATLLKSGIALTIGLDALAQTYEKSDVGPTYKEISRLYNRTGSIYEAFVQSEMAWPSYLVEMTHIGESVGRLDIVMKDLSAYYKREGRLHDMIRDAFVYPIMLCSIMVVVVLILLKLVIPVFEKVLGGLGVTTDATMRAGATVGWVAIGIMVALLAVTCVFALLLKTPLRQKTLAFLLKIVPTFRRIRSEMTSARVSASLSVTYSGGVSMEKMLEMTRMVVGCDADANVQLDKVRDGLLRGQAFGEALANTTLFDEITICAIRAADDVGSFDEVMEKVAAKYSELAEEDISGLMAVIEPAIIAALALVIGAVLLMVLLPMAGILARTV